MKSEVETSSEPRPGVVYRVSIRDVLSFEPLESSGFSALSYALFRTLLREDSILSSLFWARFCSGDFTSGFGIYCL